MLLASPGRLSLPSVKCSNCAVEIPITDLEDHVCAPAPPLPALNTSLKNPLPKPSLSPGAAASLLPQRLQGLVSAPGASRATPPPASSSRAPPVATGPSREQLRLNTGGSSLNAPSSSYPTRPSPLSNIPTGGRSSARDPYASGGESPIRSRPPIAGFGRARSGSSASAGMSPTTARPSFTREMPPSPTPPPPAPIVTQVGGEAGMAGVGRRGFAAAARAAMFAVSSGGPESPPPRASPPRQIDIGATIRNDSTPPPLSTSSGSSHSPGLAPYPESPVSPHPLNGRSVSPPSHTPKPKLQTSASLSSRASSKRGGESVYQSSESEYSGLAYAESAATDYEDDEDDAADLRRVNELRSPLNSFRRRSPSPPPLPRKAPETISKPGPNTMRPGMLRRGSESEGSDYDDPRSMKRNDPIPKSRERLDSSNSSTRLGHNRAGSGGSAKSALSSKSAYALRDATPRGSSVREAQDRLGASKSRSAGRDRSFSPESKRKDRDDTGSIRSRRRERSPEPRLAKGATEKRQSPTRERSVTRAPRKPKVCVRCEKKIDDGKWVSVDGGGVLCEKCWKNMYLPKCRRCNLPIEKQAVSSSDGQLKGKYHRECFNCHTCHKPFPDKTFYVLDGKPLCAYHYHEANDSLCAAARCGQPIEGPCAVSHAGDRYHPEHMLCEFPGYGGCKERLDEYWEIDGRMLCERHSRATRLAEEEMDDDDGSTWSGSDRRSQKNTRAMKRVTRYIDLAKR
ncbi:hypothetical protein R3P38DRAFT_2969828 [Favolaschia claudopus]|uniref:LIM zinc-binding domain-containing protein n=1 Tax=Favolaschia claudopus TaxID=2862362 RepID=A0AAW0B4M7_9AGAR